MTVDVNRLRLGMKLTYAHPNNGHQHDKELCEKLLKHGDILTVTKFDVGSWHTDVQFAEHPGVWFNSVMFSEATDASEPTGQSDYEGLTELDWVRYQFATIQYDYKIPAEAAAQIDSLFQRLHKQK